MKIKINIKNNMTNKDIIRRLILNEVQMMEPKVQSFEDNPIGYLLEKYPTLEKTLKMLMSNAFKDYITGIYIVAPKPTTFKIVLHNNQFFTLTFLEKAYEATVQGKNFYLQTIGEKERCTNAIANLLSLGNPIQTKGPEGEEQNAGGGPDLSGATSSATTSTAGIETGTENPEGAETGTEAGNEATFGTEELPSDESEENTPAS